MLRFRPIFSVFSRVKSTARTLSATKGRIVMVNTWLGPLEHSGPYHRIQTRLVFTLNNHRHSEPN